MKISKEQNTALEVKVYSSGSGLSNPVSLLIDILKSFKAGFFMGRQFFIRDLNASVRQSFLGLLWYLLPPLATAGIWIFLNSQKIVQIENVPMAYGAFALCGTMMWALLTESILKPLQRFTASKSMLAKLNFPREALLIAAFFDMLFSMALKVLVLLPILMLMGVMPSFGWLLGITGMLMITVFGLTLGIFLLPVGMLYNDVNRGLPILFQILLYLSPVIYPVQNIGADSFMRLFNPSIPYIEFIRSSFGDYEFNMMNEFLMWSIISGFMLLFGLVFLRISLTAIIERIGS
jgi:lipopolysaccharide transport system permease protein